MLHQEVSYLNRIQYMDSAPPKTMDEAYGRFILLASHQLCYTADVGESALNSH